MIATVLLAAFLAAAVSETSHAAALDRCVAGLKKRAIRAGVPSAVVETAMKGMKFDEKVVRFSRNQPEFRLAIWDYMAFLVDKERLDTGAAMMKKHDKTLRAVEKKFDVDRYILTGPRKKSALSTLKATSAARRARSIFRTALPT